MRKTKKILAAVLAIVMLFAMSMTASAATITIEDGETEGSAYSAYRLLDAVEKNTDEEETVYLYSLNEKYSDAVIAVSGRTTSSDIVEYLGGLDADGIRSFADGVYAEIKNLSAEYSTNTNTFANVEPGYYLIVETQKGDNTYSLVMLDTIGEKDITITTKESVPELVKKVQERNDTDGTTTDWQDAADYDIGDEVPFQLTGTVAGQYDHYKTYYYAFHDTLSEGFEFLAESVVVKVDDTEITEGFEVVTENLTDGCSFEIQFEDLRAIDEVEVNGDSRIVVEYAAILTEDAKIAAEGNPNVAKLEYCNDPYFDGIGDGDGSDENGHTSETPEDKVTVFTYKLDVNKVDKELQPLNGAGFTLYKLVMPNPDQLTDGQTAGEAEYVQIGEEIVGTVGAPITKFEFIGLDAGQYKLVETTVPDSYSKADDLEFTITAEYEVEADDPVFTMLTVEKTASFTDVLNLAGEEDVFTVSEGVISTDIVNVKGFVLPSTGGVGTTIFYIVGAVIMLVAVGLFVKSRRIEKNK